MALELGGQLVLGRERAVFAEMRLKLHEEPFCNLIVDLNGLRRLDSTGLGEIVCIAAEMHSRGVPVSFCCRTGAVQELLRLTRVSTLGPIFGSVADALAYHNSQKCGCG